MNTEQCFKTEFLLDCNSSSFFEVLEQSRQNDFCMVLLIHSILQAQHCDKCCVILHTFTVCVETCSVRNPVYRANIVNVVLLTYLHKKNFYKQKKNQDPPIQLNQKEIQVCYKRNDVTWFIVFCFYCFDMLNISLSIQIHANF